MHSFGLGFCSAIPSGANPTPIPFAILQDVNIDISRDLKKLRGQNKHVIAVGEGPVDITGKIGSASFFGSALAAILGGTAAAGSEVPVIGETATIPTTPFIVTVAQGAAFKRNFAVLDLTTGRMMTRGATATGAGVYAVNETTGAYTFNTADGGHRVSFAYTYTSATVGTNVQITNSVMGLVSGVRLLVCAPTGATGGVGAEFDNVYFPKLGISMKAEDFSAQNVDFFCVQSATSDSIGRLNAPE